MSAPIRDLLSDLGIPFREQGQSHHVTHGWIGIDCPYCSAGSGKFKLGINLATGFSSCWSCGRVPLVKAIMEISGGDYYKIKDSLEEFIPQRIERNKTAGKVVLPRGVGPLLEAHREYLKKRGFYPEELERVWGLQGIGVCSSMRWRIFIPVHLDGRMVSWTTRSISDRAQGRYRAARPAEEEISLHELLYGEDYARHTAIVAEGPADVWRIGPGAVCTCGVAFTPAQVLRLSRFPLRAICFDNEPIAQRRARRLCELLEPHPGETVNVCLESGKDPADACSQEILDLRERFLLTENTDINNVS